MVAVPRAARRVGRVLTLTAAGLFVLGIVVVVGVEVHYRITKPDDVPALHAALPPPGATIVPGMVVFDSDRTGNFEIFVMAADGSGVRQLTDDPAYDSWWGRISPDRQRILFYRTPKGVHDRDFTKTSLWVMGGGGEAPLELRPPGTDGWQVQGHAEWSPSGEEFVMFGGRNTNPQIWVTTATGQRPRKVTDRGGSNLDPSWSPDGRTVVFVGCPRSVCFFGSYEVYTASASGREDAVRLTSDSYRDHDPYFSPDGSKVAWLTQTSRAGLVGVWKLRIAEADGTQLRWLVDDDAVSSKPEWSRDGGQIFFHRLDIARSPRFSIYVIEPDGTSLREVTVGQPGVNEYPST